MRIPIPYKIYPDSPTATKKSITGTILIAIGIPTIPFVIGVVLIVIGIIMKIRAANIYEYGDDVEPVDLSRRKEHPNNILEDTDLALKYYSAKPGKKTLKYLKTVNPEAARIIEKNGKLGKCGLCEKENVPVFEQKLADGPEARSVWVCDECKNARE